VSGLQLAISEAPRLRQSLLVAGFTGTLGAQQASAKRTQTSTTRDSGAALLKGILATRDLEAQALGARVKAPVTADAAPAALELPRGWTWASIDQLALQLQYGTSTKASDDPSGVPILRMGNLQNGELDWDNLKYLPSEYEAFPKLLLREGDVLFNRTNSPELVGKSAPVRETTCPTSFASYLIRISLHPAVEPAWVAYWLNSPFGRNWARTRASQQVGQANINGHKLRTMAIPLPGRAEQIRICRLLDDHLRRLSTSVTELENASVSASRWRESLLSKTFAGLLA
jgi:type I restriction enzyme S subunit